MRGLVFDGPGEIRFDPDLPEPVIEEPTDVIIEVTLSGLCGSDLHPFEGREPCAPGVVPGHEAVGAVVETGPSVDTVAVGDRVIVPFTTSCGHCDRCGAGLSSRCRSSRLFGWGDPTGSAPPLHGAQATRLRVPLADGTLVTVPDEIDDPTALLLTDNFPTALHAVARTDWTEGPMAIIGLGAVGLCAVAAARAVGVTDILAIDPVASRREAAESLGARTATPEDASGEFPAVVEAAGPVSAQRLAAQLAAVGATISIIAVQTAEGFGIDPVTAYDKNLTISTGRAPVRSLLDRILPELAGFRIPTETVITHPDRPLRDGPDLYRTFSARDDGLIKATFRP
ncbi:MAG: alcohol dehydrogenase catalytic domain-containing protein [Acidimicrobiia bacterium]